MSPIDIDKVKESLVSMGFRESVDPIYINKGCFLKVNLPFRLSPYPNITDTDSENFFQKITMDTLTMYFQGIVFQFDISEINGMHLRNHYFHSKKCDYCQAGIGPVNTSKKGKVITRKDEVYCLTCHKKMCLLCYQEVDIETAIKHKASLSKFVKRKDQLDICRQKHTMTFIPEAATVGQCYCDICSKSIDLIPHYSSDPIQLLNFGKNHLMWYQNRYSDLDVCMACSEQPKNKRYITKHKLSLEPFVPKFEFTKFGSMLDWYPLYVSQIGDYILVNLNPESMYHLTLAYMYAYEYAYRIVTISPKYNMKSQYEISKVVQKVNQCTSYDNVIAHFQIHTKGFYDESKASFFKNHGGYHHGNDDDNEDNEDNDDNDDNDEDNENSLFG